MIPLTFSKTSWHAWLVKHFTPKYLDDCEDLCSYIRWVILGIVCFVFVTAVAVSVVTGFTWDIAWLFNYVQYINEKEKKLLWDALNGWQHYWYTSAYVTNVFLSVATVIGAIGLVAYIVKKIQGNAPKKPPGFAKAAYHAFKDKVCFTVNFK